MSRPPDLLWLSRADVESVGLGMGEVIDALEEMFVEKAAGRVEMPPKPGIHTRPDAFIHAMPAWVPALGAAGMKWVSGYPANVDAGLPYISGILVLNDPETGLPTAVMDATWITAERTGAATAVAAKRLASPDARSVGIVACGVQGRSNLRALAHAFDLERVMAYDLRPDAAERFAREMHDELGLAVEVVQTPRAAVEGLDLVVTSGPIRKSPEPVIRADWLAPGAFACPLDFDSYWTSGAFEAADLLATDDLAQFEFYRTAGYFGSTPRPRIELAELVAGEHPGRSDPSQRAICLNLGLALEDVAVGIRVLERARSRGIGTRLAL